jgi:hypothetical protein
MSELAAHEGSGIRYRMHLSAPNGGVAQMVRSPDGMWVEHAEYERKCVQLKHVMDLVGALMVELDDTKAKLKEIEGR